MGRDAPYGRCGLIGPSSDPVRPEPKHPIRHACSARFGRYRYFWARGLRSDPVQDFLAGSRAQVLEPQRGLLRPSIAVGQKPAAGSQRGSVRVPCAIQTRATLLAYKRSCARRVGISIRAAGQNKSVDPGIYLLAPAPAPRERPLPIRVAALALFGSR